MNSDGTSSASRQPLLATFVDRWALWSMANRRGITATADHPSNALDYALRRRGKDRVGRLLLAGHVLLIPAPGILGSCRWWMPTRSLDLEIDTYGRFLHDFHGRLLGR